jgi:ribosome-associated heat shock protein Hsp15
VDVNGDAAKPSKMVRSGDLLQVTLPRGRRIVRVQGLTERRGSGSQAVLLYEDLTPPPPPREERILPPVYRPPGSGRPTKRARRRIDRLSRW